MEAITTLNSPMASMITIEDNNKSSNVKCSHDHHNHHNHNHCNHNHSKTNHQTQSILSMSSIMSAFRKASFNLGSKWNLKSSSAVSDESISIPNECYLTLNIVGIRDTSSIIDSLPSTTTSSTISSQTANKSVETVGGMVNKLVNEVRELESINETKDEESKDSQDYNESEDIKEQTPDIVTTATNTNTIIDNTYTNESESSLPPMGLFGDDDSSDDDDESKDDSKSEKNEKEEETKIELCLKTLTTPLTKHDSVFDLKEYLKKSEQFDLNKNTIIQLIYSNILLEDEFRTLEFYGINNNSFILAAILEGNPLSDDEYKNKINELKLQIKNDSPAHYQTGRLNSTIITNTVNGNNDNDDRFAALRLFTRRHVQSVRNGNVAPPPVNTNTETKKESKPKAINLGKLVEEFKLERTSCFDFLTFETIDNCWKMPCGHGISEESLIAYVLSQVNCKNTLSLQCPQLVQDPQTGKESPCKAVWHYPIIKKILQSSLNNNNNNLIEDKQSLLNFMKMELLASRNVLQELFDVQKCGHCNSVLFRPQSDLNKKLTDFQAVCPMCTDINRHKVYDKYLTEFLDIKYKIKQIKKPKLIKRLKQMKESISQINIKRKLNEIFIESSNPLNEIELNNKLYTRKNNIKKHRKTKKRDIKNVVEVPRSFLNAFKTDSDYEDDDDSDEDININENNDNNNVDDKIINPYLAMVGDDDWESSEYEYVTTDDDFDYDSDNDDEPINENNDTKVNEEITTEIPESNAYNFANNNNYDSESDSDTETETVAAQRINLFKDINDSSDDDDEDDNKEDINKKVEVKVRIKSEDEIELEKLELLLSKMKDKLGSVFRSNEYNIIFCWGCNVAWSDRNSPACGNSECSTSFRSQILSILTDCDVKKIGSQSSVPSVRACPKCGQLINHWEACKHMQCQQCQTQFCFVCLKKYIKDKGWQCGSYSDKCPGGVVPRQTCENLPSMNVATVSLFEF